jgi:hypothetical protein
LKVESVAIVVEFSRVRAALAISPDHRDQRRYACLHRKINHVFAGKIAKREHTPSRFSVVTGGGCTQTRRDMPTQRASALPHSVSAGAYPLLSSDAERSPTD